MYFPFFKNKQFTLMSVSETVFYDSLNSDSFVNRCGCCRLLSNNRKHCWCI